jgi:hypothetical protein
MRRVIIACILVFVACREERPAPPARPAAPPRVAPSPAPPVVAKKPVRSTSQQCAGDGSYEAAVDCIRIAAKLTFKSSAGDGELARERVGAERLSIHRRDGNWTAEPKPAGIIWTHDGQHATNVPPELEKLYQRLTLFPDPQKKEGSATLAATEGDFKRYEFTDANNGDKYVVWVSTKDGHIARLKVNEFTIAFE